MNRTRAASDRPVSSRRRQGDGFLLPFSFGPLAGHALMVDAIVIGAGPNGLVAAATLARQGWQVLLLEAKGRPGGALYSEECTLPGFLHDVGAAFFPFAEHSPALRSLDLAGVGLEWARARRESSHPAPDGSCATIARDLELSVASF